MVVRSASAAAGLFKKEQQEPRHKCAPMSPRGQLILCMQVAILWVLALSGQAVRSSDQVGQIANMNDALKYLREIDKYYAQVARPSTRSETVSHGDGELFKAKQALKMLKLQELDKIYTNRARPRFGKRTQVHLQSEKHDIAGVWQQNGMSDEETR